MKPWMVRLGGFVLMLIGAALFVWSVKYITAEWPQIFVGLLSVFCSCMGFGILIMPSEDLDPPKTPS